MIDKKLTLNLIIMIDFIFRNVVSTWSSGTGASGLLGAVSYAAITSAGITPRTTVLLMLVVPIMMSVTFFFILEHTQSIVHRPSLVVQSNDR